MNRQTILLHHVCLPLAATALIAVSAVRAEPGNQFPVLPPQFHERQNFSHTPPTTASENWWVIFADPVLDDLVARAERGNTSIQEAAAHLSKARAQLRGAAAERVPQLGLSTSASHQSGPLINAAGGNGDLFTAGASLSYEIDLLGKLSKSQKAARLDVEASEDMARSVRLITQADTVQGWFRLCALDEERAVIADSVASATSMLSLAESSYAHGLAPELDVLRARAELAATNADLSAIDEQRARSEHALLFLLGEPSGNLPPTGVASRAPPEIPAGLPSSLLTRRPDILAADRAVQAAQMRVRAAKVAWFPNISLTATGGGASAALGDLLKSSAQSFGIGLLLSLPIFDGGRQKAAVKSAVADGELANISYRSSILSAFQDVEDQLSFVRLAAEQNAAARMAVDADKRAAQIISSREQSGLAGKLEWLDAHRTELKDRRLEVRTRYARAIATAGLVRALGGGW